MRIASPAPGALSWESITGYLRIARLDHWIKNLFVLPGFVVALSLQRGLFARIDWFQVFIGGFALCLITSSNYVLNEILDAPFDRIHPFRSSHPLAAGQVNVKGLCRMVAPDGRSPAARR